MPAQRKPHKQYPGIVKTARGRLLNIHELKNRQTKPIPGTQATSTVTAQERPKTQTHVTGFMPSMEGVQKPAAAANPAPRGPAILGQMGEPDEGPAMADYTGIEIRRAPGMEKPEDAMEASTEAYKKIMGDLNQQYQKKGLPPRSDQSRRARKA